MQILERSEDGWRLVTIDADKPEGRAPKVCQDFLRSTTFQILMMLMVLSNAIIQATFVHHHDASDEPRKRIYYYIEAYILLSFQHKFTPPLTRVPFSVRLYYAVQPRVFIQSILQRMARLYPTRSAQIRTRPLHRKHAEHY